MFHQITLLPEQKIIKASHGQTLLAVLRDVGVIIDAPCDGKGSCRKCRVTVDGTPALSCQTIVDRDMTVTLPAAGAHRILSDGITPNFRINPINPGYLLAIDLGTTTVVGYLLDPNDGHELATESRLNPQTSFGADVISRIRAALDGRLEELSLLIRNCIREITLVLCEKSGIAPSDIGVISLVGNPAMQQLFFGISPKNLASLPFSPVFTAPEYVSARPYLPLCDHARLIVVPDISGFVGADTLACVLAAEIDRSEDMVLLVDIGTNGEMVLGNKDRMVSCSTAAGPALEGANIQFGMRGMAGAIDHVWKKNNALRCHVIGDIEAVGICGSGLIDAIACALDLELLNARGRIQTEDRLIHLTDHIHLTQADIREVQMEKGAIAAGIKLMANELELSLTQIDRVYLAGAFGSFMNVDSACRIGLLPAGLREKITAVGNAAGSGAKLLACDCMELDRAGRLVKQIEFIELASLPDFQREFAMEMYFNKENLFDDEDE